MKKIPFMPLKVDSGIRISKYFLGVGEMGSKMFPSLGLSLEQAESEFDVREWVGLGFFISVVYGIITFNIVFLTMLAFRGMMNFAIGIGMVSGLALASAMFFYFALYPKLAVRKKIKDIEHNLSHVLRHMLVQVRAGVTVFNSMRAISVGGYGKLSEEFGKAVNDVNTGRSEVEALERLAIHNPSLHFRRVIWQLVNSLKSGADIGDTLKEIVENITTEQKTAIKKYGSELNPLSLFYMMLVVILPTLGIVFLLIMFSFVGIAISLETVLLGILLLLVFIQVMFVGMIKNKRPVGI